MFLIFSKTYSIIKQNIMKYLCPQKERNVRVKNQNLRGYCK